MLSCLCSKSIAGMARPYKGGVVGAVGAPSGAMLFERGQESIAGMARSYI